MRRLIPLLMVSFLTLAASPGVAAPLDDRAAVQASIDALGKAGGGTLQIDQPHQFDGPLYITASNITLQGHGKLTNKPPYVGPLVVIGPATTDPVTLDHRPASLLDASAAAGRTGVATGGTHTVLFAGDGLTLGCVNGGLPGYYSNLDALTVETCVAVPKGVTLPAWTALMGFGDGTQFGADPFNLGVADDPLTWCFSYRLTGDVFQQVKFPVDPTVVNHLAWQWNGKLGRNDVWVNGHRVKTSAPVLVPGSHLRRQSGLTPYLIGATGATAPYNVPTTNLAVYGLKVSGGVRYADADVQSLLTGASLTDYARYFHEQPGDAPLIAYLPLDDPAASPTVRITYPNGEGVAFWVPPQQTSVPTFTRVAGLTLEGHVQSPVFIGRCMYVKLQDLDIRFGMNAIASLPTSAAMRYKIEISSCTLAAYDAPLSFLLTILTTTNVNVLTMGVTCVRESNCRSRHQSMELPPSSSYQDTFFELHGGICRLTDIGLDNENGGPADALVRVTQGWGQPARLVVDGFDISGATVPFLELVGLGTSGGYTTTLIDVRNLSAFNFQVGNSPVVLRAVGADFGRGTFDVSGLTIAIVQGPTSVKLVPPLAPLLPVPAPGN